VTHITVQARTAGFWRCGRSWPAEPVTLRADDLPAADLDRLRTEPELIVTLTEDADPAAAAPPPAQTGRGKGKNA
jgi:hypothetical protein